MHQYTCEQCNTKFTARWDVQRKYCTVTCRTRANSRAQLHRLGGWQNLLQTHEKICELCGASFMGKSAQRFCTRGCSQIRNASLLASRSRKSTALATRPRIRIHTPTATVGSAWVNGPCAWCRQTFTARLGSKYCGERCKNSASSNRKHRDRGWFSPTPAKRQRIFRRDNGICHLCGQLVDDTLTFPNKLAATLDHLQPQATATRADHRDRNLALAHMVCNSIRQTAAVDDELKARCLAKVNELNRTTQVTTAA